MQQGWLGKHLETRLVTSGKGKDKTVTETTVRAGTRVAVVRLKTDGTLDSYFGNDGVQLIDVPGCTDEVARSVQILSDGDILIGGGGSFASGSSDGKKGRKSSGSVSGGTFLIRLDSDGSLDDTFGGGSLVIHNPDSANSGVAMHGLGIQTTTDRIVALGLDSVVRAYDIDTGTVDADFASSGAFSPPSDEHWTRLVVDGLDDTVLVCGWRSGDGLVLRIEADGSDDDGGIVVALTLNSSFNAIEVDDQGRVVAGGQVDGDAFVLRIDADGTADSTFGISGISESTGTSASDEGVLGLAVDGADVILVGTTLGPNTRQDWFVARWCGTTAPLGS